MEYFKGDFTEQWERALMELSMEGLLSKVPNVIEIEMLVQMEFPEKDSEGNEFFPGIEWGMIPRYISEDIDADDDSKTGYMHDFFTVENFGREKTLEQLFTPKLYEAYQNGDLNNGEDFYSNLKASVVVETLEPFSDFLATKGITLWFNGDTIGFLKTVTYANLGESWDT